jgi:hypothetical protein
MKFEDSRDPRVRALVREEPGAEEMSALLATYDGVANPESFDVRFLAPGRSGAKVFLITHTYKLPVVVKVGLRADVERELRNYRDYEVEETLPQELRPTLKFNKETNDYALVVYSWAGGWENVMSFRDFFERAESDVVVHVIDSLMADMFRWHRTTRAAELPFDQWSWDKRTLGTISRAVADWPEVGEAKRRILAVLEEQQEWRDTLATMRGSAAVCHGDLNCNNVLLAERGGVPFPKVIDFASVIDGSSPARDWAKFEREIKLRCLRELIPDAAEYAHSLALVETSLSDGGSERSEEPCISKACRAVESIRRNYVELTANISEIPHVEYLYYLLCWTLAYLANQDGATEAPEVRNAILTSALGIIEQIDAGCRARGGQTSAGRSSYTLDDNVFGIQPPGGDPIHEIEDSFRRHTDLALKGIRDQINGFTVPRAEFELVEDQLSQRRPVLFTGDAGSGKSGVSKMLALASRERGKCVLFLDARQVGHVRSESELRAHLALKGSVESAVACIARAHGCRVIIDQFDNAAGSASAAVLGDLAVACSTIANAEVVVVSRKTEVHEEESLADLSAAGFVELTSYPLAERKVSDALRRFEIEPSDNLVDLSLNLLNLSLIVTIKAKRHNFDFSAVTDEVDLWEQYLDELKRHEGVGVDPVAGEILIGEAVKLAEEGLRGRDRTFRITYPHSPAHARLDSWQVITPEEKDGDIYRFRHEKLQDFLVAWGAVRRGDMPPTILAQFNEHRTRNVFVWMDRLYARRTSPRRKRFLRELLSDSIAPFYTQAAVLERYIKSEDPASDADSLEIIVQALSANGGLRDYYFRRGPHPAWVPILWERGFFNDPPKPRKLNDNYIQPFWMAQEYLMSVAAEVPAVIIMHVQSIPEDSGYIYQAVRGLCLIPANVGEAAIPRILSWLGEERLAGQVLAICIELIKHLLNEKMPQPALDLFRKITAPKPAPNPKEVAGHIIGGEAVSLFGSLTTISDDVGELINLLSSVSHEKVAAILEENLCAAVNLEAKARRLSDSRVWNFFEDALDDGSPYTDREYKNHLVRWLRKILEEWVSHDTPAARPLIKRYLTESHMILRRLGFHILQKFPKAYRGLVAQELRRVKNSSDWDIHDEFLKLLRNGYPVLSVKDQQNLISRICRGLPREDKKQWKRWVSEQDSAGQDDYVKNLEKRWVRDRLAMLGDYLRGEPALLLKRLIDEVGEPDYPDPRRRYPVAYHVTEISPLSEQELAAMPLNELIRCLEEWQQYPEHETGPQRVSSRGLARTAADVILGDLDRFGDYLVRVALTRYEVADAIFDRLTNTDRYSVPWELKVSLCERLLADKEVRSDMSRRYNGGWVDVRQTMLRVIEAWLDVSKQSLPADYLDRVRDLILILVDDPDPQPEDERPRGSAYGDKNPSVIAWNHVRPSAVSALVDYAWYRARLLYRVTSNDEPDEPGPCRLEPLVRETLTRKLDRGADPSPAVHSVYGHRLPLLLWLDKEWLEAHVDQIFPDGDSEEIKWLYAAAWDSYMRFTATVSLARLELLRTKYERAIDNLSNGVVTRTSAQPARELANHLLIEYLHANYELRSPAGQDSLIAKFYTRLSPAAHADAAWVVWKLCDDNRDRLDIYWPRARALWQWRVDAASGANHPPVFDDEMNWFSLLLNIAYERETITSLWPLLEGILPHVTRADRRTHGWDEVERYLSKEVERDPVNAIRMYHLMHVQRKEAAWSFFGGRKADKILETAAACQEAQQETLDLISLLGHHGNHRYLHIYNRLSS